MLIFCENTYTIFRKYSCVFSIYFETVDKPSGFFLLKKGFSSPVFYVKCRFRQCYMEFHVGFRSVIAVPLK